MFRDGCIVGVRPGEQRNHHWYRYRSRRSGCRRRDGRSQEHGNGVVFQAESTNTGNYTISQLPVGTYAVTVKVQGFKTYTHTNLALAATQVIREDIALRSG